MLLIPTGAEKKGEANVLPAIVILNITITDMKFIMYSECSLNPQGNIVAFISAGDCNQHFTTNLYCTKHTTLSLQTGNPITHARTHEIPKNCM